MDSIRIDSGVKRLAINDDPDRVITFNPSDVAFVERFYALIGDFETKQADYERRAADLDAVTEKDKNDLPVNLGARIAFMREVCETMHGQIDGLFGEGTAQTVFEGALDIEMIASFFEGLTPYIQSSRQEKLQKYARPGKSKGRKAVMR